MTSPCTVGVTGTQNVLGGYVAPPGTAPGPIVVNPDGTITTGSFQPARVPVCVLVLSASQALTDAQTPTPDSFNGDNVAFDTAAFDTFSNAVGDGSIAISLAGYYQLNAALQLTGPFFDADPSGWNEWQMSITVNGVGVAYWTFFYPNGGGGVLALTGVASNIAALNAGDVVRVSVQQQGPQSPGGNVYVVGIAYPPDMISYLSASYIGKL